MGSRQRKHGSAKARQVRGEPERRWEGPGKRAGGPPAEAQQVWKRQPGLRRDVLGAFSRTDSMVNEGRRQTAKWTEEKLEVKVF